jgi:hypothetical protein
MGWGQNPSGRPESDLGKLSTVGAAQREEVFDERKENIKVWLA